MEEKDNTEKLYDIILKLKEGNEKERKLARKCIGMLSDDTTTESYNNRLEIVSELLKDYI